MVTGTKNQSVSNMEKKTLDILADAISDVGSLQWWHADDNMVQVEFRDIQLYDKSKPEKDTHTIDVIAIRFIGNVFAVFLDNLSEEDGKPWYERLYDDEIPAIECEGYRLTLIIRSTRKKCMTNTEIRRRLHSMMVWIP